MRNTILKTWDSTYNIEAFRSSEIHSFCFIFQRAILWLSSLSSSLLFSRLPKKSLPFSLHYRSHPFLSVTHKMYEIMIRSEVCQENKSVIKPMYLFTTQPYLSKAPRRRRRRARVRSCGPTKTFSNKLSMTFHELSATFALPRILSSFKWQKNSFF